MPRSKKGLNARRKLIGKLAKTNGRGANGKATKLNVIDQMINNMFMVLPCTTREEIAKKLSKYQRETITVSDVDVALSRNRADPVKYGFVVNYASTNIPTDEDKGRFCVSLIKKDGSVDFDEQSVTNYARGLRTSVRYCKTRSLRAGFQSRNVAKYLRGNKAKQAMIAASKLENIANQLDNALADFSEKFADELKLIAA